MVGGFREGKGKTTREDEEGEHALGKRRNLMGKTGEEGGDDVGGFGSWLLVSMIPQFTESAHGTPSVHHLLIHWLRSWTPSAVSITAWILSSTSGFCDDLDIHL